MPLRQSHHFHLELSISRCKQVMQGEQDFGMIF